MVNQFPPVPSLPDGMSLREFARDVMKWGIGDADARARSHNLTKQELESAGVTRQIAEDWQSFYQAVQAATPQNPSAAGRAELMQRAVELLQ